MKICQVSPRFPYKEHLEGKAIEKSYPVGGVSQVVYHLSKELSRLDNDITIITTKSPRHYDLSEPYLKNVSICRVPIDIRIFSSSLIALRMFKSLIPSEYDVIHAHTPVPLVAEIAALRNLRKKSPFILSYQNDVGKEGFLGNIATMVYRSTFGRFLLEHSDVIVTSTKSYAMNSKPLARHLHKVKTIPNGVDITRFHQEIDRSTIRRKHFLDENSKVLLFVGRLDLYKGCDYLVRAVAAAIKELPPVYLILVGIGPEKAGLRAIAKELGIDSNTIFAGFVSDEDLPYYYAACDIFVLPSVSPLEGFGVVQLEAMACGKPVITTTIPGPSEVDTEGLATIHVPPRDIEALTDAITKLISNEDLARKMGEKGRRLVEAKYTWSKIARDISGIYRGLM
jgi:glycosyltransferase involved in cell wall biosynthesis